MTQVRTEHGKKGWAEEGAGQWGGRATGLQPPAPADAQAPTPRPAQSVAGIEAAILNPSVTLA